MYVCIIKCMYICVHPYPPEMRMGTEIDYVQGIIHSLNRKQDYPLSSNFLFLSRYLCLASSTCSSFESAGGLGCCWCWSMWSSLSWEPLTGAEEEEDGTDVGRTAAGSATLSEADSDSL